MRVLVFFDLPTGTKAERKIYTRFRKNLIKDGFEMIQFSVYCRISQNHDDANKYVERIKTYMPSKGSVRLMKITEKQYQSMQILVGEKTAGENFLSPADLVEL